jgi:hypothetical protein
MRAGNRDKIATLKCTAARLRRDAKTIVETYTARPPSKEDRDDTEFLLRAAKAYDRVIKRHSSVDFDRLASVGFCIGMGHIMDDLFGFSIDGLVAKIGSVALEQDIQQSQVREWSRGLWGMTPRKRVSGH